MSTFYQIFFWVYSMNRNVKVLNWASLPPLLNDDDKNDRENAWEEKGNTICKMISKQETQMVP